MYPVCVFSPCSVMPYVAAIRREGCCADFTRNAFADVASWAMFNRPEEMSILFHALDENQVSMRHPTAALHAAQPAEYSHQLNSWPQACCIHAQSMLACISIPAWLLLRMHVALTPAKAVCTSVLRFPTDVALLLAGQTIRNAPLCPDLQRTDSIVRGVRDAILLFLMTCTVPEARHSSTVFT